MKTFFSGLSIIMIGFFIVTSVSAQTLFHYDTVPNPNSNQRQLYKYEIPSSQQNQNQQNRSSAKRQPQSQVEEKKSGFDKSKLLFGGSFGMSFGDYTSVSICPQAGYAFNQYFATGLGVSYDYYKYKYYDQSLNYLGTNLYGRLTPIKYFAIQFQPEIYKMWGNLQSYSIDETVPCLLAGAGLIMPVGSNGGVSMMLYYDLLQDDYSPYRDQIVYSIGYVFNF